MSSQKCGSAEVNSLIKIYNSPSQWFQMKNYTHACEMHAQNIWFPYYTQSPERV